MTSSNTTCIIRDALPQNFTAQPFNITGVAALILLINQSCPRVMLDSARGIIRFDDIRNLTSHAGNSDILPVWFSPWNNYDTKIVLGRLIDYKLPLLVLILQLPRAPLGWRIESFTLLHLVGNPVASIASLLYTLSSAFAVLKAVRKSYGPRWSNRTEAGFSRWERISRWFRRQPIVFWLSADPDPVEENCKAVSLVLIAYATIGMAPMPSLPDGGEVAEGVINEELIDRLVELVEMREGNPQAFYKAARSLAADRRVNKLPVFAALFGFIMAVVFKYLEIDHNDYDGKDPQAIGIWSLSSSMTINWPIVAMFLACIVGVPKSADSTRRILHQLEEDLESNGRRDLRADIKDQINSGAIPNYRPDRYRRHRANSVLQVTSSNGSVSQTSAGGRLSPRIVPLWERYKFSGRIWARMVPLWKRFEFDIYAFLIVSTGPLFGVWLAAMVPPRPWNCRTVNKLVMWGIYAVGWFLQIIVDHLPIEETHKGCATWWRVGLTAVVDLIVFVPFAWIIFVTQFGVFNRLGCYTVKVGKVWGVLLPPFTWDDVRGRLRLEYPAILFGSFALQFLICGIILAFFWEARKVFRLSDRELEGDGALRDGQGPLIGDASQTGDIERQQFPEAEGEQDDKKGPEENTVPVDPTP